MGSGVVSGAGVNGDCILGVPRPWVGLASSAGGLWGLDDGALEMGMFPRVWTGSCWMAASVVAAAAGGRGEWVVVGGGSCFGLGFGLGRCCLGWRRCVSGVVGCVRVVLVVVLLLVVRSFGRWLGFGVRFGVGVRFQVEEHLGPEVSARRCRVGGFTGVLPGGPESPVWGSGGPR